MKPLLFLDVDDAILSFSSRQGPKAAPYASDFLHWAADNFEVRWLTSWTPSGQMHPTRVEELAKLFDISPEVLKTWNNPRSWWELKTEALDWNELKDREWYWLEDELLTPELRWLSDHGVTSHYFYCNVTRDPLRLLYVWRILAQRTHMDFPKEDRWRLNFKDKPSKGNAPPFGAPKSGTKRYSAPEPTDHLPKTVYE